MYFLNKQLKLNFTCGRSLHKYVATEQPLDFLMSNAREPKKLQYADQQLMLNFPHH